jgi:D-glycero-alpha-D-manno-heptose-7-phosphate kinase
MIVRCRAPLRLGLAGGGTDIPSYAKKFGGQVLNATIDRYAYASIKLLQNNQIIFNATDQDISVTENLSHFLDLNGTLNLHKATYNYVVKHFNEDQPLSIELTTFCDAPPGSGLGSSSTLVVSMLGAFLALLNINLTKYEIADIAFNIERIDCQLLGGSQDQYSATFGGFNFMEFGPEANVVTPIPLSESIISELEASLILFFSGVSRESAKIIAEQNQNIQVHDSEEMMAMHKLKEEAVTMHKYLKEFDIKGIAESMTIGWKNKKTTAKLISNDFIDEIYQSVMTSGALSGKVSGAGGGGFMLFLVPPEKRIAIIKKLNEFKGQVSNCHFTKQGVQSWRVE